MYCDPDPAERRALKIIDSEGREAVWMDRVQAFSPNTSSIIFTCGADHSLTFLSLLQRHGLNARIHCGDWTLELFGKDLRFCR
jgi:hypothetical protein